MANAPNISYHLSSKKHSIKRLERNLNYPMRLLEKKPRLEMGV
jgi:hypothetical protein